MVLVLLCLLFPILFLYAHNSGSVSIVEQAHLLIVAMVLSVGVGVLGRFFSSFQQRLYVGVAMGVFLFFSFGHFKNLLHTDLLLLFQGPLALFWTTVLFLGVLVFWRRVDETQAKRIARFLKLFVLILLVYPTLTVVQQSIVHVLEIESGPVSAVSLVTGDLSPDVYYIILDGYARADVLGELYGYDNSDMVTYLQNKGFYVASSSTSNYSQTTLSLGSSLNMTYMQDLLPSAGQGTSREETLALINDNVVVQAFRDAGYRYVIYTSGYWWTTITNADELISPHGSYSEFENLLFQLTPVPDLMQVYSSRSLYERRREQLHFAFDHIPDMVQDMRKKFVFAHIVAPHPPFVFDQNGAPIEPTGRNFSYWDASWFLKLGGTTEEYLENYKNQLMYVNKKVKIMVETILENSNNPPIIILQADHGPGSQVDFDDATNTNFTERHAILNAYYFPGEDMFSMLYPNISPVNTFRVVFNTYFGTTLKRKEDRAFYSTYRNMYEYVEVTDTVQ